MKKELSLPMRALSLLLAVLMPLDVAPVIAFFWAGPTVKAAPAFIPQAPKLGNRTRPVTDSPTDPSAPLHFAQPPTVDEIFRVRLLREPLVPARKPTATENAAVAAALIAYQAQTAKDDYSALQGFLTENPTSPWAPTVELNLGYLERDSGHFTSAIELWKQCWDSTKASADAKVAAVANCAVGELAQMYAWIGRYEWLEPLLTEIGGRELSGPATQRLNAASAGLAMMTDQPDLAFRCGPMALDRILSSTHSPRVGDALIHQSKSVRQGISLEQVWELSEQLGMHYQMAKRSPGAALIIPSVIHWKLGHYGALTKAQNGRYLEQDPTFNQQDVWMAPSALDEEASGYFLVPTGQLPAGWTTVAKNEADQVWGRGNTGANDSKRTGARDAQAGGGCPKGMATYSMLLMTASLRISDTPLYYHPPIGLPVEFNIAYSQLEASQPATFGYTNFGPKWTCNWITYVEDDHATQGYAKLYQPGGGAELYSYNSGTQTYALGPQSHATLTTLAGGGFVWSTRDGGTMTYSQPYGIQYFLTKVTDPSGNTVTLSYDSQMRLVSITDAIGQVTTLAYNWPGDALKVTRITDPFGRHADFTYTTDGHLSTSSDMMGITSSFTYGASDFVATLTTPYGTTNFTTGTSGNGARQWIQATDPMGATERCEFNQTIQVADYAKPVGMTTDDTLRQYRNTFYWGKKQYEDALNANGTLDYAAATIYHWMHSTDINVTSGDIESVKSPLTGRVFFNYQGQSATQMGTSENVTAIGRVLSNGQTQLSTAQYNAMDMPVTMVDPAGRQTNFIYATNNVDLVQVSQQNGANAEVQSSVTYDAHHHPLTVTDTSGQTTTLTYNSFGQVLTVTDAKNEVTTFSYDANGFLRSLTGPSSGAGGSATASFGYDGYGRINSTTVQTASTSYTVQIVYDNLDRLTQTTYPDGTTEKYYYQNLDLQWVSDRLGRWTEYFYDATQHIAAVVDPMEHVTQFERCTCGELTGYIDPKGNHTFWDIDTEGRPTTRYYPDGSMTSVHYDGAMSQIISATDAMGQVTYITYNIDGSIAQTTYTNAQIPTAGVSYTYDPVYPRVVSLTDGIGTTQYTYNPIVGAGGGLGQGQLATVQGPPPNPAINYQYDELGRVIGRTFTSGATMLDSFSAVYDPLGRVSSVTNALGVFNYSYIDATSEVSSVGYPNGQTTNYSYYPDVAPVGTGNGERRLQQIQNVGVHGETLSQFSYNYDIGGRITDWQRHLGTQAADHFSLGYDANDELLSATRLDLATGSTMSQYAYGFDSDGNRTSAQQDSNLTSFQPNVLNQILGASAGGPMRFEGNLTQYSSVTINGVQAATDANNRFAGYATLAPGTNNVSITATNPNQLSTTKTYQVTVPSQAAQTFNYDLNGNLTNDGAHTYQWDAANRLVSINYTGTQKSSQFTYDGMGRRVGITELDNGVATNQKNLFWEGLSVAQESDAVTGETRNYPGGGEVINGTGYYGTGDHLGSTRELTDASGVVHAEYDYDPYGVATKLQGDVDATHQYAGYYRHAASGYSLTPFRAYNPALGSWLSRDPAGEAGGGLSMYSYAAGNPVSNTDPLGLSVGGVVVNVVVGLAVLALLPEVAVGGLAGILLAALFDALAFGAGEIAEQLVENGGNFSCIDWGKVLNQALLGAAFGAAFRLLGEMLGGLSNVLSEAFCDWAGVTYDDLSNVAAKEGEMLAACEGGCFVSGTLVEGSGGEQVIESVKIGDRVRTDDNSRQASDTEVDQANWQLMRCHSEASDRQSNILSVALLRPKEWMQGKHCEEGGHVWMALPEFGFSGCVSIDSIDECPSIECGLGRVVTGTMSETNVPVLRLCFAETDENILLTQTHRLYSESRHAWVPAGVLKVGELVKTETGTLHVASSEKISGGYDVYNIEVETDHRYFVGTSKIFSHNNCGEAFERAVKAKFANKIIQENEKLYNSAGEVVGEIDFETNEAIVEVGTSLAGKMNQLHKLAQVAADRAKRLDIIYGPDTSWRTVKAFSESLSKKWGSRVRFIPFR